MLQRAFGRREDVVGMRALLTELRMEGVLPGTFQYGDLMYEMHHPLTGFAAEHDIRLWESDDGQLRGFVFFRPPDNPEFFLRPELYGSHV